MDISVFEVIGPVMMGPSSSGTAGMTRIGTTAYKFLEEPVKSINLTFCPPMETEYYAFRSHLGIIGGILGFKESETENIRNSYAIAKERGIDLSYSIFEDPQPAHPLTVDVACGLESGRAFTMTGVSVGGGSISIIKLDGFDIAPSSMEAHLFVWAERDISKELAQTFSEGQINVSQKGDKLLYYIAFAPGSRFASEKSEKLAAGIAGAVKIKYIEPFLPLGFIPHTPLFTTFDELIALSEKTGKTVAQLTVDYEINRTGKTEEAIRGEMREKLALMKETAKKGLKGAGTLCGFNDGSSGKKLMEAYLAGKTMGGDVLPKAIAIGLAIIEVSGVMGVIVATPTAGSSGVVPGPLLALSEKHGFTDEQLIDALFVSAAMGIIMYFHGSTFSGSAGGCQAEVGVASGMAAGAIAYLGGGDARRIANACALSIKNILGLICDPIRGSIEAPCIKRQGVGIANAFSGADMALAGIDSFIPPDEVIDSLVEIQRKLPKEMRSGCCGAPGTPTGKWAAARSKEICRDILLPKK